MTGDPRREPNLHRDNAAEMMMRVLIAPLVLIARFWVWCRGKMNAKTPRPPR